MACLEWWRIVRQRSGLWLVGEREFMENQGRVSMYQIAVAASPCGGVLEALRAVGGHGRCLRQRVRIVRWFLVQSEDHEPNDALCELDEFGCIFVYESRFA